MLMVPSRHRGWHMPCWLFMALCFWLNILWGPELGSIHRHWHLQIERFVLFRVDFADSLILVRPNREKIQTKSWVYLLLMQHPEYTGNSDTLGPRPPSRFIRNSTSGFYFRFNCYDFYTNITAVQGERIATLCVATRRYQTGRKKNNWRRSVTSKSLRR